VVPKKGEVFWPPLGKKAELHIKTPIEFQKQTERVDILKMTKDCNEKRFDPIEDNCVLSK